MFEDEVLRCPECGKVLQDFGRDAVERRCKHLMLWHTGAGDEGSGFVLAARGLRPFVRMVKGGNALRRFLGQALTAEYYVAVLGCGTVGGQELGEEDWFVFKRK